MELDKKLTKLNAATRKINEKMLVVVEGARDEAALMEIGITAPIIRAVGSPGKVAARVAEQCAARKLVPVVFFDFDATGEMRTREMEALLINEDCVPNTQMRKTMRECLGLLFFEDAASKKAALEAKQTEAKIAIQKKQTM